MSTDSVSGNMPDQFDRLLGALDGLPDVMRTKPSTIRNVAPLGVSTQMFIVQTYRQADKGDTIFLEAVDREGTVRLVIPAKVANAISSQREALNTRSRRAGARQGAQKRRDAGIVFFQRKKA
jgi:hypothetical protein